MDVSPSPFILALPKAELHLHLEGAVHPETLVELSRQHNSPLSGADVQRLYSYEDFAGFLMAFKAVTEHLRTADDYELITYRLLQKLAIENVVHAEVYVSVGVIEWRQLDLDEIFEGLDRGRARGERDFGVSLYWIFDAVRHFGSKPAERVLQAAIGYRDRKVIGIGIGGDEARGPAEWFAEIYREAERAGLRLTAHAGESVGPESVGAALEYLHAERIGHGLTAIQDPELVERLAREQIPVEVCLTSNLRTRCCSRIEDHPFKRYLDAGVLVTLNTDDPAMFGTSLSREYALAQQAFGLSDEQISDLARNSFQASFLPEMRKRELLARL